MLPPGHIAAGYLVARGILAVGHPALSATAQKHLIWWGMFFAFAPDLDMFWIFIKKRRFIDQGVNHRQLWSHAPILWLIMGLSFAAFGFLSGQVFIEYFGLLMWLGSWSHFALDTVQHGVMWLWPWRIESIALIDQGLESHIPAQGFLLYWFGVVKFYVVRMALSFTLEILVIIVALAIYFR